MHTRRLKRTVIKEEFVALTGDYIKALILNQFIYWSERISDFDQFIAEEKSRAKEQGKCIDIQPRNGWIYKNAEELSEETMLNISPQTMLRHIKYLVDNGWVAQRTNPEHKWDRTKQYRVNLIKIHQDLLKLGYTLQDYKIDLSDLQISDPFSILENAFSKMENRTSKSKNQKSNMEDRIIKNGKAIPEITTEITNRDYHPSINPPTHTEILGDQLIDGKDGLMDEDSDVFNKPQESQVSTLIQQLCQTTGATPKQLQKAIKLAKQLDKEGKIKSNFIKYVESIAKNIVQEELLKKSTEENEDTKGGKKDLIKSLYMS